MSDDELEVRMTLDVLVVFGIRDPHGVSPAEAIAEEARARGLRAECAGAFDGASTTLRALYTRTASLLERLPDAARPRFGGSLGRAVRERLAETLLELVAARRPRVVVVTDPLARAVVEAVLRGRIGVPSVLDASEASVASRACFDVSALAARGPRAPRRVLLAASDLGADEVRAAVRSFTRTLGVELDVHTGLDPARAAFAARELDVALVAHADANPSTLVERLAACDLVIGAPSAALVSAAMASGRALLALPARSAEERRAEARLLRAEAGLRADAGALGDLVSKTVDHAFAARLGANGRRAFDRRALEAIVDALGSTLGAGQAA
jgi:hypothetical protein